mgnify:CR=1 FL=1
MYLKPNDTMNEAERIRLDEITFYDYVQHIYATNKNPVKVYDYIEILCNMTDSNLILMNSLVSAMMCGGHEYIPTKQERIYLLSKSSLSVRAICKRLGISQTTYYQYLDKPPLLIASHISKEQHEELVRFFNKLSTVLPERI